MTSFARLVPLVAAFAAVLAVGACNNNTGSAAAAGTGATDEGYSFGDPKAPVTVLEFGALTCPHCAHWEDAVWPAFKAKYVDTGKVHYIFREDLIHPEFDAAAGQLTRCVPKDKYWSTVQAIFRSQPQMFAENSNFRQVLQNVAVMEGLTEAQFNACLTDTKGLEAINQRQMKIDSTYHVEATPTFIINGKKYEPEDVSLEKMSTVIDPLLKK
jgi:protein-disulfide isomerase